MSFWTGLIVRCFFDVFPLGGFRSPSEIWDTLTPIQKVFDQIHHMILPIIAWTITSFATMTVLMKNSLLENLSQDYVRTAFAKGGIVSATPCCSHNMANTTERKGGLRTAFRHPLRRLPLMMTIPMLQRARLTPTL